MEAINVSCEIKYLHKLDEADFIDEVDFRFFFRFLNVLVYFNRYVAILIECLKPISDFFMIGNFTTFNYFLNEPKNQKAPPQH